MTRSSRMVLFHIYLHIHKAAARSALCIGKCVWEGGAQGPSRFPAIPSLRVACVALRLPGGRRVGALGRSAPPLSSFRRSRAAKLLPPGSRVRGPLCFPGGASARAGPQSEDAFALLHTAGPHLSWGARPPLPVQKQKTAARTNRLKDREKRYLFWA